MTVMSDQSFPVRAPDVTISGISIAPGESRMLELPLAQLYTHTAMTIPVHVVRGKRDGPRLFLSAAIHGDELNGIEIIRRVLKRGALKQLRGTLIAVPIVNVYGVTQHSRYLPDRRDLNRSFPGSGRGSLAARLAHVFMTEIVCNSTHGIDLHTGGNHRTNLPQIRADLNDEDTLALARRFGAPVLINAGRREGSLREAAHQRGVPVLLYEGGEALRFDEVAIRAGVLGVLNVMRQLGMLPAAKKREASEPVMAQSSTWMRAPESGVFRSRIDLGARVQTGDTLGIVSDPCGDRETPVEASYSGVVIGRTNLPLVLEGEAVFHIACFEDVGGAVEHVEAFQALHDDSLIDT